MEKSDNKPWDDSLRKLVRANPQAFVSWILGDAEFIDELPEKLKTWNLEVARYGAARVITFVTVDEGWSQERGYGADVRQIAGQRAGRSVSDWKHTGVISF